MQAYKAVRAAFTRRQQMFGVTEGSIVYIREDDGSDLPYFTTDPSLRMVSIRQDADDNWFVMRRSDVEPVLSAEEKANERGGGMKFDDGKPQGRLLMEGMPRALARVVDTLTFGAKKYAAHSWQTVPNAHDRYADASWRHDNKRALGEKLDPETGIHHRAHHIINELFLLELELRDEENANDAE